VGKAISQDTALTSKVLRIANSSFYGFPREITTIHSAIVVLGFANIRNLVITASIADVFPSDAENDFFNREQFWRHSLACGIASKLVAKIASIENREEAFVWGLLHDVGKIVLHANFTDYFVEAVKLANDNGICFREAEEEVFGISHAEVGGIVADGWNLPPSLIKCIRFHHSPDQAKESMRIASIVHTADILCSCIGLAASRDQLIPCINEQSWNLLGLNGKILSALFRQIEAELEKATAFFTEVK
jgi:putative nucleotidyltransferase with HDIG domain